MEKKRRQRGVRKGWQEKEVETENKSKTTKKNINTERQEVT